MDGIGPLITTLLGVIGIVAGIAFVVGLFIGGGLRKRAWAEISGEFAVDAESASLPYQESKVGELVFDEQRFPGRLSIDEFGIVFQRYLGKREVRLVFPWSGIDSLRALDGAGRAEFRVRIGNESKFVEIPWSSDLGNLGQAQSSRSRKVTS